LHINYFKAYYGLIIQKPGKVRQLQQATAITHRPPHNSYS